jgi:hypothetical protein
MATASDILERAYSLIGYKDPNEPLSGADAQYGLNALNDMIDAWNTQMLYIFTITDVVATVSGLPIPIGPGLAINTARPVTMEKGSFARIQGLDYPITWLTNEQYQSIPIKDLSTSIPEYGFYDGNGPTGNIYLWPYQKTPTELHLMVRSQLASFPDLSTDVPLVQGYKSAIVYSLAEEIAPGVRELPELVARKAIIYRRAIRQSNANVPLLQLTGNSISPLARFLAG